MKRILLAALVLIATGALAAPAHAADPITISSSTFTCNYRQNLVFELQAQSSAGRIRQIALYIQLNGVASSARQFPEFTPGGQVKATYEWRLTTNYLPPGVTGQFWWTIEDDAGNKLTTDKQSLRVEDSGKPWKQLSNAQYALYWYNGSDAFGQALFDRGVQAINYLQQDIGISTDTQIQAFIYGNTADFRNALAVGSHEWTGGQSFSDYSIILIHIEPTELEWGKDSTTHELTHQVIGQKIDSPLGDLSMPHWINEGMAMYYQTYPGKLSAQFSRPLSQAIQSDTVPALRTLSGSFPADTAAANLAYAQSYSVVDFIYRKYGKEKMAALFQEFKKGGEYDGIFQQVLGLGTDELDNEWRKDVGLKPRALPTRAARQSTPFPTFSLSTDLGTPTPKPAGAATQIALGSTPVSPSPTNPPARQPTVSSTLGPSTGDASPSPRPTATPAPVALQSTPATTPTPGSSSNPLGGVCGGTFVAVALGLFGVAWRARGQV